MVDQFSNDTSKNINKSLSADSELHSAYEYLRKGDYKLCKKVIDKKFPKLKSEVDKVNFNIIKVLLLNKMKKTKESKKLIEILKKEFLESQSLANNSDLSNYFKNVLRELNEEVAANEIFKNSIKNYNLLKIPQNEQTNILKELTLNYEFGDLYSKVNSFMKNDNNPDLKFLTLLKYEVIYILAFKLEKLSKTIANLTLKEMLNNYETLSKEKGFIDILVKYLIGTNDSTNFIKLFENKKIEFTNAPMDDLIIDIYFKNNETVKLSNLLIENIKTNFNECNFNYYQRLVNYHFYILEKGNLLTNIKFENENKMSKEEAESYFKSFKLDSINESSLSSLSKFFHSIILFADKKVNFNAYKSAIFNLLLIYNNLIIIDKSYYAKLEGSINELTLNILCESVSKQSILTEISKFFIYLDDKMRKTILDKFRVDISSLDLTNLSDEQKEKIIFFAKLDKLFGTNHNDVPALSTKINELLSLYLNLSTNSAKLEKGERILGDDIIVLINEYFFEYFNNNNSDKELVKLAYSIYTINSISTERSPYNYDISLFYVRIASLLNLPAKVLEILKFMNLKGPQFETVSYIALPCFVNNMYKPGLTYLIENFEKWETINKKSIRKTFWKMFTGRNFWNTEELLLFLNENENSYFKHILGFIDIMLSYNDNHIFNFEDESIRSENFNDITEVLVSNYSKYEKNLNKLSKNQDLVISIFKFKKVEFFNLDFEIIKKNVNYSESSYKYKIDSLWKNSLIFENYPGYKNNYLIQKDIEVLGVFDNLNFLNLRMLNKLLYSCLNQDSSKNKEYQEKYQNMFSDSNNQSLITEHEIISKNLFEVYSNAAIKIENIVNDEEKIEKYYTLLKTSFIEISDKLRANYNIFDFKSQINFINHFQFFKFFYLPSLTLLTSKIVDLINDNKKTLKDSASIKNKIINLFKSPMMNILTENATGLDNYLKAQTVDDSQKLFLNSINANDDLTKKLAPHQKFIEELASRFFDEQKDILKGLIENSKVFKNFIKENI